MKRVRADFVAQRSVIECDMVEGLPTARAWVLSVRDVPGGVVLRVQPDFDGAEVVDLPYRADEWVTVLGYSVGRWP
jgi:hypothetical protein